MVRQKLTPEDEAEIKREDAMKAELDAEAEISGLKILKQALRYNSGLDSTALAPPPPQIVTFEPYNVLIKRCVPVGLLYRDCLLRWTGLMLPRPDIFEDAYDEALARQEKALPRFQGDLDEWWRKIAYETYVKVLTPAYYDPDEIQSFEDQFENVFRELHDSVLVGNEAWEPAPRVDRILSALRDWKLRRWEQKNRLVVGIASTNFDARLGTILTDVLGEANVRETFDFICANSYANVNAFDLAQKACDDIRENFDPVQPRWTHIVPDDLGNHTKSFPHMKDIIPPSIDQLELATAASDIYRGRSYLNLLDLLDIWNLPKIPDDDLIETTRTYSVYDPDGW